MTVPRAAAFGALALGLALSGAACAPVPDNTAAVARGERGDAVGTIVARAMREGAVLGVQVAAARDCRVLVDRAYGYTDSERARPLRATDLMPIGSVTKSLTGALAHDLALQGTISEEARITAYLPVRAHAAGVTVRELETQTSGLAEYNTTGSRERLLGETARPAELRRALLASIDEAPGSARGRWHYSNSNYLLLGRIVEAATRRPLDESFDRLLRRLALPRGEIRYGYDVRGAAGHGYEFDGYSYRSAPADPAAWAAGAGGLAATARGLVDFDCAFFRHDAGAAALTAGAGRRAYRWGWYVERRPHHDAQLYHDGVNGGFRAVNLYVPRLRLAVAVIANTSTFDGRRVVQSIVEGSCEIVSSCARGAR